MSSTGRLPSRLGFTVLEAVFSVALLAVVMVKVAFVFDSAAGSYDQQNRAIELEDQARRVLERIALAVMSTDRSALIPDQESPLHSSSLQYEVNLGVEDGHIVWSDPEQIASEGAGTQVVWRQDLGAGAERRVVWSNLVRPFLEGELPNGVDDNANGLVDEAGLSFVIERDKVTIFLTLQRPGADGEVITQSLTAEATCRN